MLTPYITPLYNKGGKIYILKEDPNLRFEDLSKALQKMGYVLHQPHSGGSHYTFRKPEYLPITIPKHKSLKRVYVSMVAEIVKEQLKEESDE